MELDELHVGDGSSGTVGHGDAVPRHNVRVGGLRVDLPGAPTSQHGGETHEPAHLPGPLVQHVGPKAVADADGRRGCIRVVVHYQLRGKVVLEQVHVGVGPGGSEQGPLHLGAGEVGGVDDAAVAVAALPCEVEAAVGVTGELGA